MSIENDTFRLLVDAVDEYAIFLLDPSGMVSTWNRGAESIKGYTADEVVGRHFSIFYPPEDCELGRPDLELAQALETGTALDEGWRVRKDGTRFWASVSITALRNDQGELLGFAKITRDQTERKEADALAHALDLMADRERIAQRLYESVIHRSFGIGLLLAGAVELMTNDEARARVQRAIDELDTMIREARSDVLGGPTV